MCRKNQRRDSRGRSCAQRCVAVALLVAFDDNSVMVASAIVVVNVSVIEATTQSLPELSRRHVISTW